jgi:hypothetical protein
LLLIVAFALVGLTIPARKSTGSASGCTRFNGYMPGLGNCLYEPSSTCYYCEYSEPGGTYACGENEDGSVKRCFPIDYQNG